MEKPYIQLFIPEQEYREIKSEGWTRPHGIGIIGTYLRQKGHNVELFSGVSGTNNQEMLQRVRGDIIGISTTIGNYVPALDIARKAKNRNPNSTVVLGGPEATQLFREILINRGRNSEDYCVDAVILGDGVRAFYEIVSGNKWETIPNLAFIKEGKIITTARIREDKTLWPIIDNSLFNMEKF